MIKPAGQLVGAILSVDKGEVRGWVYDRKHPDRVIAVRLLANGRIAGEANTSVAAGDLVDAGLPASAREFRVRPNSNLIGGQTIELAVIDESGVPMVMPRARVRARDGQRLGVQELDANTVAGYPPVRSPHVLVRLASKMARRVTDWMSSSLKTRALSGQMSTRHMDEISSVGHLDAEQIDAYQSVRLPVDDAPLVSILIPVHNQFHLTMQCLSSIVLATQDISYEVVLIDDASTDATIDIESLVSNLRVLRPPQNLGFVRACNAGAEISRGSFLCFLNNDTVVSPGWLSELQSVFERFDGVGASGSKLVYPDGRLQDAGGIVWGSGIPWNAGHGEDPDAPEFNYVRDVDYLTGASLMVSRQAWDAVDGFSDEYAPAYYEDTDLAFKLREAGYRTLYCPQSCVVHYEGMSNGTSTDSGVKQYQLVNAERFVQRWKPAFEGNGRSGHDIRCARDRRRGTRVLMFDIDFPHVGRDAGSYAAMQEIRLLISLGCKITFVPVSLKHAGRHVDQLQRLGVECISRPWVRSIDEFLERNGAEFDLVYITRYVVAERVLPAVRRHCTAKIALNLADLHFLRELRTELLNSEPDISGPLETRRRELAVLSKVDAVLTYNSTERDVIASHLMRNDHLHACPWVLDSQVSEPAFEKRTGLVFLGGFGHPPNIAAMDWFVSVVMSRLAERRPDISLSIYGSHVPKDETWSSSPNVFVKGYAETLIEVFDSCRVFVAPLLSGAGIKGKVLDSIGFGVPAVLSPIAAEATGLVDGVHGRIAMPDHNGIEDWIEAIIELHDEQAVWTESRRSLLAHADKQFSAAAGQTAMRRVLDCLDLEAGGADSIKSDSESTAEVFSLPRAA